MGMMDRTALTRSGDFELNAVEPPQKFMVDMHLSVHEGVEFSGQSTGRGKG